MNQNKRTIRFVSICTAGIAAAGIFSLQPPLEVSAAGNISIQEVTSYGGASALLGMAFTEEECLAAAESAQGALWGYTNLGIAKVEKGNLNVRETPDTSGKLVGKMPKDSACEILEITENGWAKITSGDVNGYVCMDYLYTGADAVMRASELINTVAVVNVTSLKVRDEATTESAVLTQVPKGEQLDVLEILEDWVKVSIDGDEAYVYAEYVTVEDKLKTAITMSELRYGQGVSDLRVDIVEYAKQFLGNRYVYGGTSLTNGVDCSGFTMGVYKHFGITLSHHSGTQAREGTKITASELQPGDLIFYADSSGKINHVAMYIGNGQVIHASDPKSGIKISNYKYRTPVKYVSILKD